MITLNEPVSSVVALGYITGLWPPGFFLDDKRVQVVLHNLIDAHVQAYDVITTLDDVDADNDEITKKVGFSHHMAVVEPAKPHKTLEVPIVDNSEAAANFDYFMNHYFLNAVVSGEEDLNYLKTLRRHDKNSPDFIIHDNWKDKLDFIGLNYYRRIYVYYHPILDPVPSNILSRVKDLSLIRFIGGLFSNDLRYEKNQPHSLLSDVGWEIYPEGLYKLMMQIKNYWKKPVFVTENGIADSSDRYRAPYIIAHLRQIRRARQDGADVIGYLHWSLMDNYEWHEGYRSGVQLIICY